MKLLGTILPDALRQLAKDIESGGQAGADEGAAPAVRRGKGGGRPGTREEERPDRPPMQKRPPAIRIVGSSGERARPQNKASPRLGARSPVVLVCVDGHLLASL